MAKMTVLVNGSVEYKTSGVNAAFCWAGDRANALLHAEGAPLGTTVVVTRDGAVKLTYTLVDVTVFGTVKRDWKLTS